MRGMLSDNKDLKVPEKPKLKCMGFTYNGVKLFNMLPLQKPKCLQNYVKRLDMEKHSFILIIFIFLLLSFNKSVKVLWIIAKYTDTDSKSGAERSYLSQLSAVMMS